MTAAGTPSTSATTTPTHPPYKMMRAKKGRMIAGVAAGLAKASGLDVTVVRICIGLSLLSGLGFVGYILLWIVLPDEQPSRGRVIEPAPENTARIIRISLVAAALLGALHRVGFFWPFSNGNAHTDFGLGGIFGLILLSIGVGVLFSRHRPDRGWWEASPPPPVAASPTTPAAAPAPADDDAPYWTASTATQPVLDDEADDDGADDDYDDDRVTFAGPLRNVASQVHTSVTEAVHQAIEAGVPERGRSGAALGWARAFGWFVLLWWLVGVVGFVALWRYGALSIDSPLIIGVAAWACFTSVLHSLTRVRNPSAVVASLFVLAIPAAIGLATVRAEGPVGTRTLRPVAAADLHRSYRQAIGELELDLSSTHLSTEHATDIDAHIGAGGMVITIPNDAAVTVNTKIQTGGYDILSKRTAAGVGQSETLHFAGCKGGPTLRLKLRGGAGWMQVKRANGNSNATCPAAA